MKAPFFSIIIPTYNRAGFLIATINSVLSQLFDDWELIIVDDGSTDNTEELINVQYSLLTKLKYIKQSNSERGKSRNTGLENASGKYINYFDSDDTMLENHLMLAYNVINELEQPPVFHFNYIMQDREDKPGKPRSFKHKFANKMLIEGNFLPPNCVFLRRDVAMENKFIEDRTLASMEDWELWLRIAAKYPVICINEITSKLQEHDNRSVATTQVERIVEPVTSLITYVTENQQVVDYYKNDLRKFFSSCYTYIALHIALAGESKILVAKYLLMGIKACPTAVFKRRFLVTLKYLAK